MRTDTTHDDDFHPATAGDDPIWLGGVEYILKSRSDDLVQAAEQRGYANAMEAERKLHQDRIEELEAKLAKAVEALSAIDQYGSDTLSGRADGPDDRSWQREGVLEMTRRARTALAELKGHGE